MNDKTYLECTGCNYMDHPVWGNITKCTNHKTCIGFEYHTKKDKNKQKDWRSKPRKPQAEKLQQAFVINLTKEDKESVIEIAKLKKMKASAWIRELVKERIKQIEIWELGKISKHM